jgi:hypothetical protein
MMKVPTSRVGQFLLFGLMEGFAFFIIVANTRAFTQGNYFWTAVTDTLFTAQTFFVSKLMIDNKEARSWAAGLGMTVGGTCGSLASIAVTKLLFGH